MKIIEYPTRTETIHWLVGLGTGALIGYTIGYWRLLT